MNTPRRIPFAVLAAALVALALVAGVFLMARQARPPAGDDRPPLAGADVGGAFSLVNQDGARVTDADFAGRYRLIYFGFTFCPDICPTDLQRMGRALRAFETEDPARAARVQPIFITVDPERDTPAAIRPYVAAFHPRLVGLTGTPAEIEAVKKTFRVYAAKREEPGVTDYLVDHSSVTYLFGPDGAPISFLDSRGSADDLLAQLRRYVR